MSTASTPWLPIFEDGQVVSAADLNQISNQLNAKQRFDTRHFHGHGILFGLDVGKSQDGTAWVLQKGAAIDKLGRVIVVDTPISFSPCRLPSPSLCQSHDHVGEDKNIAVENFTPLLVGYDVDLGEALPQSMRESGRRRRAKAEVVLIRGRVQPFKRSVSKTDSPGLPGTCTQANAYDLAPLRLSAGIRMTDGESFMRRFAELLEDVRTVLERPGFTEKIRTLTDRLRLPTLIAVPNSRDILTIAILNDVVYTLWQWERAGQYLDLHLSHSSNPWPYHEEGAKWGIPLGWMYRDGQGNWHWDGRWRAGFAIGLSRLEHIVGYSPNAIREICVERLSALVDATDSLGPLQPEDTRFDLRARPETRILNPTDYKSGTGAWLHGLRFDRPRKEAAFWPLDPLRSSTVAPAPAEPSIRDASDPRLRDQDRTVRSPSPSIVDPVNDPFEFCSYSDGQRLDRWNEGLVCLAGLLGFELDQARAALRALEAPAALQIDVAEVVQQSDDEFLAGLEIILMASFNEPLIAVVDDRTPGQEIVISFARRPHGSAPPIVKEEPKPESSGVFRLLKSKLQEIWEGILWAFNG